ncbi:MAG: copper transporter [Coriobacteriia bacterium]|nr:copper transporter [Coriobacteriia bacterium]
MYNMRYHLASLIAVFLALSIGLLLGGLLAESTPETVHDTLLEGIERDIAQTRETNERVLAENILAFTFADMLLDGFTADRLEDYTILLLGEEGQELQLAVDSLESAGARVIRATPEFDAANDLWTLQDDVDLDVLKFHGIVNVYQPDSETNEFLSSYFIYLREVQEEREVPLLFATIDDVESELVSYAWEEGFSGTNQLGNRYGTYTLVVLLISETEGKYGSAETADALYPPIPESFISLELSEEEPEISDSEDAE